MLAFKCYYYSRIQIASDHLVYVVSEAKPYAYNTICLFISCNLLTLEKCLFVVTLKNPAFIYFLIVILNATFQWI